MSSSKNRTLLDRAVDVMATLHRAIEPMEDDPELAGRVPPAAMRAFVDALANIDRERCAAARAEPPYRVRGFWSPCHKYIASACVSENDITVLDDDGRIWEPAGPEQDMTQAPPHETEVARLKGACESYRIDRDRLALNARALQEHIAWAWSIIASAGGGDWSKESAEWREAAEKWERARNPYEGLAQKSDCNPSASTDAGASPSHASPPASVECPKCRTQLAFEGDECWSCKENANAPINS